MQASYRIVWTFPDGRRLDSDGYRQLNLLGHLEILEVSQPQACGGQAECGTCRVRVLSGEVTPMTADERELFERFPKGFEPDERLACQARPRGDLEVALLKVRPRDLRDG